MLRKRAPLYKGANPPVFVENSGFFGEGKDVSGCVDGNNKNPGKEVFSLVIDRI